VPKSSAVISGSPRLRTYGAIGESDGRSSVPSTQAAEWRLGNANDVLWQKLVGERICDLAEIQTVPGEDLRCFVLSLQCREIREMLTPQELAKMRFAMSAPPQPGGEPGIYEEQVAQWVTEKSFFRDFIYRNAKGKKKGDQLVDGIVLFGDVMFLLEVKAQIGSAKPDDWVRDRLSKAVSQLKTSKALLQERQIPKLQNDFYGELDFEPGNYPNIFGIVVLAHDSDPYYAPDLVPELLSNTFPIHVFSLKDFELVSDRFDTAGDMITYLETRTDVSKMERLLVQDEARNLQRIMANLRTVLAPHFVGNEPELLEKALVMFERKATGKLALDKDWQYSLLIDDLIAHAHDLDPNLPWNENTTHESGLRVSTFLGWLTRDRRIKLGKLAYEHVDLARDGKAYNFHHFHPSRKTSFVFLASSASRAERVAYLSFLVSYAMFKDGSEESLGVATEATGGGRSYDFVAIRGKLSSEQIDFLKSTKDPFYTGLHPL